jgi:hypothetical protein
MENGQTTMTLLLDEDHEEDSDDSDELLLELLGCVSFDGEWKEEGDEHCEQRIVPGTVPARSKLKRDQLSKVTGKTGPVNDYTIVAESEGSIFDYSYRCSGHYSIDGRLERPPVRVADLGSRGRGNGLITSIPITSGSVIYTERAAVATQIPPASIQACQYCFRSLASIDSLSEHLPCSDLWPIPRLDFDSKCEQNGNLVVDMFGRGRCATCKSLFCSKYHFDSFKQEFGNCCKIVAVSDTLEALEDENVVQAPVALAVRLFAHCVEYFRGHQQSLDGHFLEGFCGKAEDLDVLEFGIRDSEGRYTLLPLYESIVVIFNLSSFEKETLSLECLHRVAAHAGRNGFGLHTQSPFKTYHAGLLRKSMSRDSEEHQANIKQMAQALVGRDQLERGMDRDIEAKVAPAICAVFPLTARCNHSCEPNTAVKSQEFVDTHIDVVAVRDLSAGEEILISYIPVGFGVGKRSTVRRRRELQAKYLFYCDCSLCSGGCE